MKRLLTLLLALLLLILPLSACAAEIVDYTADFYVADYANVLSDEVEGLIVLNNDKLEKACGAQIVVVMVGSINGSTIENYAYTLFNEWGIGAKDKNNGLLLLVAVNDGEYWFMPGKGLQDYLNAGDLDTIASEYFIPSAQSGNFDEAMRQVFGACFDKISIAYNTGLSVDETLYQKWLQSGSTGSDGAVYLQQPLRDMSAINASAQEQQPPQVQQPPQADTPQSPREKESGSILPIVIIAIVAIILVGAVGTVRNRPGKAHRPAPRPAPRPVPHPTHRPPMGGARPMTPPPMNRPVMPPRPPMGGTRPPVSGSRPPVSGTRPPMSGSRPPMSGSRPPMGGSRPPMSGSARPGGGSTRGGGMGGSFGSSRPSGGSFGGSSRPSGGGFGGGRSGGGGSTRGGGTGGRF